MNRIIIKKGNLYGAINDLGEIIIEPIYENMKGFSNGFAAVCKDDKWGYIGQNGNQIIDFLYCDARDFSIHGVAAVKVGESSASWSLIRKNGQLVDRKNNKYYFIDEFNSEGYAIVGIAGGYQIIDIEGKHMDDELYYSLKYIPEQNIFLADKLGKSCFIDTEGKVIVETKEDYDEIYYPSNGLCQVAKDGKYGYIDEKGKLVISLKYKEAYEFSHNGLAFVVCENGLGGYINKDDEFVIKPIFESGSTFKFGLAAVSKDGEYIFVYENGNKAIDHTFKYAGGFAECGLAKTELFDGRQGLVRPDSSISITLKEGCELAEFIGKSKVTKFGVNGKEALINNQGEIITGLRYDEIIVSPDSNLNPFSRNGLWGYLDDEGNEVIPNIYKLASEFTEHNSALVGAYNPIEDKIKKLYINDEDKIIDPRLMELFNQSFSDKYSKVYRFKNGLALAIKKEKTKILNAYGQEILAKDFNLRVMNNSLIIDIKGQEAEEIIGAYEYKDEDEFKGYYDEDGFAVGIVYEIIISFKEDLTTEKISKLINEYFDEEDILEVEGHVVKVLWKMLEWECGGDIENVMYYLLDAGSLGNYDYYRVS